MPQLIIRWAPELIVSAFIAAVGFSIHTTWQLGQIKGSLDRDLVEFRKTSDDHEQRIRDLERGRVANFRGM
jgi:hypothetical protein